MATRMLGWPRFYTLTKRNFEYSALGTDRLAVEGQSSPHLPAAVTAPGSISLRGNVSLPLLRLCRAARRGMPTDS